jgi:hypothetical protein
MPLRAAYAVATVSTLLALLSGQPAFAHVDVRPAILERGAVTELRIELPQLRDGPPPVRLAVEGPGVEVLAARLQGLAGAETRWSVRLRADAPPGRLPVVLRAGFADGASVDVDAVLTVIPAQEGDGFPVAGVVVGAALAVGFAVAALAAARRRA